MSDTHSFDGRPVTVPRLARMKRDGERITMVTAYDATFARLFDEAGIDVLLDDRDVRPGFMFADMELIGIPHRIVIGDKGLGRSSLGIDALLNQKGSGVRCVYVLIGQRRSAVINTLELLRAHGAMDYSTLVVGDASALPGLKYLAPFAGCAVAEHWMARGQDTLVVYDDVELPLAFRRIQAADLIGWRPGTPRDGFDGLIAAIASLVDDDTAGVGAFPAIGDRDPASAEDVAPPSAATDPSAMHEQLAAADSLTSPVVDEIQLEFTFLDLVAPAVVSTSPAAGAVAALQDFVSPINVARGVMEKTPHVMLAGTGAVAFARQAGYEEVSNPADYYRLPVGVTQEDIGGIAHGTVGAVVLDTSGGLAAATSTGGTFGKLHGRIGDTPLIGPGTWADDHIAVSCTGIGEHIIRAGGASSVAFRYKSGIPLQAAVQELLDEIKRLGGDAGVIAVTREGEIAMPYNSEGMKRASASSDGELTVATFA